MPGNRIRVIRKTKGMSADALAERVGLSRVQVTRIESGARGLSLPHAEGFAMALETTVEDVLGLNATRVVMVQDDASCGMAEEAVAYEPGHGDIIAASLARRPNLSPYQVQETALDQIDIKAGDVLIVDISAATVDGIAELAASSIEPIVVLARCYHPTDLTQAFTLVRQFIPPNLLITNSRKANARPLNLDTEDVHIKGLVVAKHRVMGKAGE